MEQKPSCSLLKRGHRREDFRGTVPRNSGGPKRSFTPKEFDTLFKEVVSYAINTAEQITQLAPDGRLATPEELMKIESFICDQAAAYAKSIWSEHNMPAVIGDDLFLCMKQRLRDALHPVLFRSVSVAIEPDLSQRAN